MTEAQRIKESILVHKTRHDLTNAGVAAILGISTNTLYRRLSQGGWKHGELHKLADAWSITISELEAGFGNNHTNVSSDP